MAIPPPQTGAVIRYNYLWAKDAEKGKVNAKARPACIVAAIVRDDGQDRIVIIPITHSGPRDAQQAAAMIEIPDAVRKHLGLDEEQCWIVANECNVDVWPSPDLTPVPGSNRDFLYGFLPPKLFEQIKKAFVKAVKTKQLRKTGRK